MRTVSHLTVGADGMAFNSATGHSFVLNSSAALIVKAIQAGQSQEAVVGLLCDKYQLAKADAERDVTDFYGRLRSLGLL